MNLRHFFDIFRYSEIFWEVNFDFLVYFETFWNISKIADPKNQAGRGRPKLNKSLNKSAKGTPAKKKPNAIKTNAVKPERPDDENDYVIGDNDDPYSLFFDNIVLLTDSDGDPISGPFLQLPSKKQYPDYYEDIAQPIALDKIRQKVIF